MKYTDTFKEAKRLYDLGFAIMWLHPKSKRPIESKWTSGERKPWSYLAETYIDGLNVGVRLGEASQVDVGYLACIDLDVKDPACKGKALTALGKLAGDTVLPEVRSGSGNGSRHLYCITTTPFKMITVAKEEGFEICVYSTGRQMVLPPSTHPNGKPYVWFKHIKVGLDLPVMKFEEPEVTTVNNRKAGVTTPALAPDFEFAPEAVDIDWLPISEKIKEGIKNGTDVTDRSGYLLVASSALISAGLTRNEILSVLTDASTYLGACGYDHAKTKDRKRAAQWIYKYTLGRTEAERNPANVFKSLPHKSRELTEEEIIADAAEWAEQRHWKQDLIKSGQHGEGPPKGLIQNVVLILDNAVNKDLVARNTFAYRDIFLLDTPWGSKKNQAIIDEDISKIKYWLSKNYGFEPKTQTIEEALLVMSCRNSYDPVKEALDALPEWDNIKRLDTWLIENFDATGSAAYNGEIFRKWIVAMIMRVYQPGAKFDWMPIFEGPQRAGKSSFGKILADGDKHFLDWLPNLADKDAAFALQGMWVVEMGELASLRKNEIEVVKGFLSRTIDKVRPHYGRRIMESARRCVFFGTTNREQYLQDDTGNRRFKPLLVGKLDFKALARDRDQLFAEAKHLWNSKIETEFTLDTLTKEAAEYEKTIHAEKMVRDDSNAMFDILFDYFSDPEKSKDFDIKKFKLYELFQAGIGALTPPLFRYQLNRRNEMMAAKAVKMLGGEKRGIIGKNYWKLPEIAKKSIPQGVGVYKEFTEEKW